MCEKSILSTRYNRELNTQLTHNVEDYNQQYLADVRNYRKVQSHSGSKLRFDKHVQYRQWRHLTAAIQTIVIYTIDGAGFGSIQIWTTGRKGRLVTYMLRENVFYYWLSSVIKACFLVSDSVKYLVVICYDCHVCRMRVFVDLGFPSF